MGMSMNLRKLNSLGGGLLLKWKVSRVDLSLNILREQ